MDFYVPDTPMLITPTASPDTAHAHSTPLPVDPTHQRWDDIAAQIAAALDTPAAMVNFPGRTHHNFVGLYVAEPVSPVEVTTHQTPGRKMPRHWGGCPHAMERGGLALPLDDVRDYPRFTGNQVVNALGVRSYNGVAVVINGKAEGTVCGVDTSVRKWDQKHVEKIKEFAAYVGELTVANR